MHENVIFGLKITHFWMKMKIWFQQETKILRPYNYKVKRRWEHVIFSAQSILELQKPLFTILKIKNASIKTLTCTNINLTQSDSTFGPFYLETIDIKTAQIHNIGQVNLNGHVTV